MRKVQNEITIYELRITNLIHKTLIFKHLQSN